MGAPQRIGRIWPVVEASHFVTLPVALAGNARNPPVHDLRRGTSARPDTQPGIGAKDRFQTSILCAIMTSVSNDNNVTINSFGALFEDHWEKLRAIAVPGPHPRQRAHGRARGACDIVGAGS
jgi:hypothetical protein